MDSQELLSKYFSGNASKKEVEEVNKWFDSSEENRNEFMLQKEVWNLTNIDRFDETEAYEKIRNEITTKTATIEVKNDVSSKPSLLKIAASLIILIVSSFLVYNYFSNPTNPSFNSGSIAIINDVNKDVILTDGSKLFLSKKGQLTYKSNFQNDLERKVKLEGRAFFNISKNKEKPFIIETNNAKIVVTGTSFLVNEKEGFTEVIVNSGSVRLMKYDGESYISLTKGDVGIVSENSNDLIKTKNKDVNYLSWMTGSFEFQNTPLKEVFRLIEDKYEVEIELKNKEIGNCVLYSQFVNRPIDEIMSIIEIAINVEITNNGRKYIVDGETCSN